MAVPGILLVRLAHLSRNAVLWCEMGANYNTILVPGSQSENVVAAVAEALRSYGLTIVHQAAASKEGFSCASTQMIFIGPADKGRWLPITASGAGFRSSVETWCCENPLASSLSQTVEPVIHLFSHDSGYAAGYSIFEDGNHREAQSLGCRSMSASDFVSPIVPPRPPTLLGALLGQPDFDYESFARSFDNLEIATAALAVRLNASVHLLDPCDIDDGDGGITLVNGEYRSVGVIGWTGIFYAPTSTSEDQ